MQRTTGILVALLVIVSAVLGYQALVSTGPSTAELCDAVLAHPGAGAAVARSPAGSPTASGPAPAPTARGDQHRAPADAGPIPVVAAENFWGSLVAQLGGNQTTVLSIVSDPNADPHEYEANTSDAIAINNADLVVVNGVGYDNWALQLLASDDHPGQVVLNVGDLNGVQIGGGLLSGNPHMWYDPTDVNTTVAAMYSDLVGLDPAGTPYLRQNYAHLNASLAALDGLASSIREKYAGTEVAATEDLFVYLANFTGLDLVSPAAFMQAVAEGNEPPAQSVVTFQCQLESGQVRALVYNTQTITPTTTSMETLAVEYHVPVVGISETIQPGGSTYQQWMGGELAALSAALASSPAGA